MTRVEDHGTQNVLTQVIEDKPEAAASMAEQAAKPVAVSVLPSDLEDRQREFVEIIRDIAPRLRGMPILLVQDGAAPHGVMCDDVFLALRDDLKQNVPANTPVTLILHSYGGYAGDSYRFARSIIRHCGSYDVLIPSRAKSAATLFALGAESIIMGDDAELGPLDAQVPDLEREQQMPALEVVQSVERLSNEAVQAVDAHMVHWVGRSGKKVDTLLPIATKFVADLMRPLFEKIDSVQFTGMSRVLKVAEDYAERLLLPKYGQKRAVNIAATLTFAYSDHDFAIDVGEARSIGLRVNDPEESFRHQVEKLASLLDKHCCGTILGRVLENHDA